MRLWHKDLIDVLPREQLISQWRECCAIAKAIDEDGTPNHILVNRIMNYDLKHFICYTSLVCYELVKRGYHYKEKSFKKYLPLWSTYITRNDLFSNWHNERYLVQNYFNLQEKYDCGGISEEDWNKIDTKFKKMIDNYPEYKKQFEGWWYG